MAKKQKVLRVLNKSELDKLSLIDNEFHRAIMDLLANTGLRVSELVGLDIQNVCHGDMTLRDTVSVLGKGLKLRTIHINQKAKEALFILIQDSKSKLKKTFSIDSPLIVSQKRIRMSTRHVNRIMKDYRESLKIETQLTPHVFRHLFATKLIKKGANMKAVQTLLGHSSITTTIDTYTHVTSEDLKDTVDLLN